MKKTLRITAAVLIILLIGYFYSIEIRKNWTSLQDFKFVVNTYYLIISLFLYLLSYLLETYIWRVCINKHLGRQELNFSQSIAVVNASGLLKYLPGRVWTYTAQILWLKKYGVSKPVILYVNLICMLGSITVSLYLGLIYLALYTNLMGSTTIVLTSTVLILINIGYIKWNSLVINKVIGLAGRLLNKEIEPLQDSKILIVFIQVIYIFSWFLMGIGSYFLAKGIGLNILFTHMFAVLASMSLSWLAGYFAVIVPGGIGVREGIMLLMLQNIVTAQTALIFPILSRLLYMIAEVFLGITALLIGIKYKVFSSVKVDQRPWH